MIQMLEIQVETTTDRKTDSMSRLSHVSILVTQYLSRLRAFFPKGGWPGTYGRRPMRDSQSHYTVSGDSSYSQK